MAIVGEPYNADAHAKVPALFNVPTVAEFVHCRVFLINVQSELRKVLRRSASRNLTGCAFLRCLINYDTHFSNSEELFVLLLCIVQVQVE